VIPPGHHRNLGPRYHQTIRSARCRSPVQTTPRRVTSASPATPIRSCCRSRSRPAPAPLRRRAAPQARLQSRLSQA